MHPSLNYTHDPRSTTLKSILLFHIDIIVNDKGGTNQPRNQARIFDHTVKKNLIVTPQI